MAGVLPTICPTSEARFFFETKLLNHHEDSPICAIGIILKKPTVKILTTLSCTKVEGFNKKQFWTEKIKPI